MHPDLEHLVAADAHDRALKALKKRKQELLTALDECRASAAARAERVAALESEVASLEAEQRELTRSIEKYEARRTSAERVLAGGGGDPEAAERQLAGVGEQLDKLETRALECMDEAESTAQALEVAREAEREAAQTLAESEVATPASIEALRTEFESIVPKRDAHLDELDHHTREKYRVLRDRKGSGVAPIVRGSCKACRMVVQQQHIADLKRGLILPCRGCGRWLFNEPADG